MESLSPSLVNTLFTILGAVLGTVLGAGYNLWKEWSERRNDRKYIIEHFRSHGENTKHCLKSIEAEFYYHNKLVAHGRINKGEASPGLMGVEDIDLLKAVYIKSHRCFSESEKKLIEQYCSINSTLREHYLRLNAFINDSEFLDALFQIQVLMIQWLCYVETRDVINGSFKTKETEFDIVFHPPGEGHKTVASKYDINYQEISDIINSHYSKIMNAKEFKNKKIPWPIVSFYSLHYLNFSSSCNGIKEEIR